MSELAQKSDITAVQSDPAVDAAQSPTPSPVHTEDPQAGDRMLRVEEQSPLAIVEGDSATGSLPDQDASPTTAPPARGAAYNRVIKCVTCRADDLPCDDNFTCSKCAHNGTNCIRRNCRYAYMEVGELCELLCDRLHTSDMADGEGIKKRMREPEDDESNVRGPDKTRKSTVLGKHMSDKETDRVEDTLLAAEAAAAEGKDRPIFDELRAKAKKEVAEWLAARDHRKDNETKVEMDDKVKKSAIAYAYLADGNRTTAEMLEVPE